MDSVAEGAVVRRGEDGALAIFTSFSFSSPLVFAGVPISQNSNFFTFFFVLVLV